MTLLFQPPVIAHRGASAIAPENTLVAFSKAIELGCQWIEFDVMRAACGTPVIFHDDTLDRTTNGHGQLAAYTYEALKKLDAGSWFEPRFKNTRIPSLLEVVTFLQSNHLCANVEIKPSFAHEEKELVQQAVAMIAAHLPRDRILYSSFSLSALHYLREAAPDCHLGFLLHEWEPNWQEAANALQCVSIHVNQAILDADAAAQIKKMGKLLLSYTVNDPVRAKTLYDWGVDAVFSDTPEQVMRAHL